MFFIIRDILVVAIGDEARIYDNTEGPMKISIDWNEDEFLLEYINILLCRPRCDGIRSIIFESCHEMGSKEVNV